MGWVRGLRGELSVGEKPTTFKRHTADFMHTVSVRGSNKFISLFQQEINCSDRVN